MKKQSFILAALIGLCAYISGCSKSESPVPNSVWMQNMAFTPASITVPVNTTITWTNKDAVAHNVTSDSGWFASGNINPNATFSRQFTATGTFSYHCTIHPNMTGKVIVQ